MKRMDEKVGYTPAEAIEMQTLMGDAIDNVPGIPGVGEKTAAKLVKKYGTADAFSSIWTSSRRRCERTSRSMAISLPMSRQLVTLKNDVEFDFDPESVRFTGLNLDAFAKHFKNARIHNLLKRLAGRREKQQTETAAPRDQSRHCRNSFDESLFAPIATSNDRARRPRRRRCRTGDDCDYRLVDTDEKFDEFLNELKKQKRFAFDTETDALGAMQSHLVGMSFSWEHRQGFTCPSAGRRDARFSIATQCSRHLSRSSKTRRSKSRAQHQIRPARHAPGRHPRARRRRGFDDRRVPPSTQPDAIRHRSARAGPAQLQENRHR